MLVTPCMVTNITSSEWVSYSDPSSTIVSSALDLGLTSATPQLFFPSLKVVSHSSQLRVFSSLSKSLLVSYKINTSLLLSNSEVEVEALEHTKTLVTKQFFARPQLVCHVIISSAIAINWAEIGWWPPVILHTAYLLKVVFRFTSDEWFYLFATVTVRP